jgi:3-hydroxyacyl-CoA dehydrogenase
VEYAGIEPTTVDQALKEFGMPIGPFGVLDMVGIDVALKVVSVIKNKNKKKRKKKNSGSGRACIESINRTGKSRAIRFV